MSLTRLAGQTLSLPPAPFDCTKACLTSTTICPSLFAPGCLLLEPDGKNDANTTTTSNNNRVLFPPPPLTRNRARMNQPNSLSGRTQLAAVPIEYEPPLSISLKHEPTATPSFGPVALPTLPTHPAPLPSQILRKRSPSPSSSPSPGPYDSDSLTGPSIALKLHHLLTSRTHESILSWGPKGDRFIIHDSSQFTKVILPRLFRHSNYSSFVRQLNKYDFHKVRCRFYHHHGATYDSLPNYS